MKKILWATLFFCALMLPGCGDDDANSTVTVPVTSNLTIDNQPFNVTGATANTYVLNGANEGQYNRRFFEISKGNPPEKIYVYIDTPVNKSTIDGTYIFHIETIFNNMFGGGTYSSDNVVYNGAGNFLHVTDKGNGVYKLEFEDLEFVKISSPSEVKTIRGSYEGYFTLKTF